MKDSLDNISRAINGYEVLEERPFLATHKTVASLEALDSNYEMFDNVLRVPKERDSELWKRYKNVVLLFVREHLFIYRICLFCSFGFLDKTTINIVHS